MNFPKIYPGLRVQTVQGELDTDHDGEERVTPPGTWGHIGCHNHADHWNLEFPNGACVVPTEAELLDPEEYRTAPPASIKECLLALKFGDEVLQLTVLDQPMVELVQEILGPGDELLKLIDAHERMRDAAAELASGKSEVFVLVEDGQDGIVTRAFMSRAGAEQALVEAALEYSSCGTSVHSEASLQEQLELIRQAEAIGQSHVVDCGLGTLWIDVSNLQP